MKDEHARLRKAIIESDNIVFFGGAGVSTESGIPDFRSADGIYNIKYSHPPETILSHSFFMQHTKEFYAFYRDKLLHPDAKPNKAHIALAELEKQGKVKAVITQNVDGLHILAGSVNVFELHGSSHRNYCMRCGKSYSLDHIISSDDVPLCACGGTVKPDVVLFEEALEPQVMDRAVQAIRKAEVLIVGGTSLNVYPAAGLIRHYRYNMLILINNTETSYDRYANIVIRDSIGETLGRAVTEPG